MAAKKQSKTKTKRKPRGKDADVPARLKVLAAVLFVILVAGIGTVKFLQSPRGHVTLVDTGFDAYYAQAQDEIGDALKEGLEGFGLRRRIAESAAFVRVDGRTIRYLKWDIPCDPGTNFLKVNVALTKSLHRVGARVRKSEEQDGGGTLVFTVGTRRYDTHRLTIHKTTRMAERRTPAEAEPRTPRPRLAIVIDDFGYNDNATAQSLLDMDLPLTITVLPTLPHSRDMLERALASGHCVLLHLPMEPEEKEREDIPMVTTAMDDDAIEALVTRYIDDMPGIRGVNNHQGSRATADERVMHAVLGTIRRRGLFFLDSLTSSKSVAYNVARDLSVPAARNDLFLDDDTEDRDVVERRIHELVGLAERDGSAIGIGHPHPWTLEALRGSRAYLKNAGVELVTVSDLVD